MNNTPKNGIFRFKGLQSNWVEKYRNNRCHSEISAAVYDVEGFYGKLYFIGGFRVKK